VSLAPHVLVAQLPDGGAGTLVALDAATTHHLRRTLRLVEGAGLALTDGVGGHAAARLAPDGAALTSAVERAVRVPPTMTLVQALSKGRRAEDAVRVACELGVDRVVPLVAERTQGRPDAEARRSLVARWQAVADAALEQSRGRWRTVVEEVAELDLLCGPSPDGELRLVAVPGAPSLPSVLGRGGAGAGGDRVGAVQVAVGPEGGWAEGEIGRLTAAGWQPVGLGPEVLRTEHAGPVALAVVAASTGRWEPQG
jgi:16S rRNA (uracil1498-N3)-methyltransferase